MNAIGPSVGFQKQDFWPQLYVFIYTKNALKVSMHEFLVDNYSYFEYAINGNKNYNSYFSSQYIKLKVTLPMLN